MAVTVAEQNGGTVTTDGTEQTLFTESNGGVFLVRIDLSNLAGGATPDIIEIREYIAARAAGTARVLEGSPYSYVGGLAPTMIELPTRSVLANTGYKVTVKRIQGTDRSYIWSELQMG